MNGKIPVRQPALDDDAPVGRLRNLGPKSVLVLAQAGVRTVGELRLLGAARAYARIKQAAPKGTTVNFLWAMAAGLEDRDWRGLSAEERAALLREVARLRR